MPPAPRPAIPLRRLFLLAVPTAAFAFALQAVLAATDAPSAGILILLLVPAAAAAVVFAGLRPYPALGRLRLVDVPSMDMLVAEGRARYRNEGAAPGSAVGSRVIQGAIEESNVNPVTEMVALIEVTRAYEASTRVMKRMDGLHGQLIQATV